MKILITGGSGLLGEKIAYTSEKKGIETYSGYYTNSPENGIPVKFDLADKNKVQNTLNKIKPDVIVHSGAISNVDFCERNHEIADNTNVHGTKNIVDYALKKGVFVVYISSDYVFSGTQGEYKETDKPDPINYYGYTKLLGEKLISSLTGNHSILRPSVIFGSRKNNNKINFALWVKNSLEKRKKIHIVTDQIVSPTYNTNLSEMIHEIIRERHTGILHAAGATQISRYEFTRKIANRFDLDSELIIKTTCEKMTWYAQRPRNSSLDVEKALRILESKPWKINKSIDYLAEEIKERF